MSSVVDSVASGKVSSELSSVERRTPLGFGCFNHPPRKDVLLVQDGWAEDGRRKMVFVPDLMSKDCRYDLKREQPECQGCVWQVDVVL